MLMTLPDASRRNINAWGIDPRRAVRVCAVRDKQRLPRLRINR
jgi:hypothetical protein